MKSIHILTTLFLTATIAIPAIAQDAATATLPKAAEVVAKHVEAVGGREKLEAMKSSVSEGSFEMPAMGLKGDFTIKLMSGKFAFEMDLPGIGPIVRGTDGENAWEVSAAGGGARLLKGIEKKQLIQQAELAAELKMEEKFDIEVVGIEKVKELDCYKLKCVPKKGSEEEKEKLTEFKFIDTKEHLLRKQTQKAVTSLGEIPINSFMEDYRDLDAIKVPHKVSQSMMGQKQVMNIKKTKINGDIEKDAFAAPEEVQKLLKKDE